MNEEKEVTSTHPQGELQSAGIQSPEPGASLDTFAGKIHVKWVPEGAVSSLGLMPFFIEFLKTSGLFDRWVEDCSLQYSSNNAPKKRDVLGTILVEVLEVEVQAGNQTASSFAQPELWALLDGLPEQSRPVFLRGDCNWGTERMMVGAEERKLPYVLKLKQTGNVKKLIGNLFGKQEWV